jgi:hypothetical protein
MVSSANKLFYEKLTFIAFTTFIDLDW